MTRGYVVGAYAASPTASAWDPDVEAAYLGTLAEDPRIAGFEMPWPGALHPHDEEWLFAHLPARLDVVLTDIPRVFLTITQGDEHYGLASDDEAGRVRALRDAAALRDDVHRFDDRMGRRVVRGVELHPGPRGSHASAESLARSLRQLAGWDWGGAEVLVEHSDALVPGHDPEKGFLSLGDELAAIRDAQAGVGVVLNWGRSAVEFHDAIRAIEHVREARRAGLLRGYVVSGSSDRVGSFDRPWADVHNAFRRSELHPHGDPTSLLTEELLAPVLSEVGSEPWIGVKLSWLTGAGSIDDRIAMIREALDALDRIQAA
jgi:hypothetical protein